MTVALHTDDRWRIATGNHGTHSVYIEHKCWADTSYKETWVPMRFQWYQFSCPCGWCKDKVPEGLQALWVLLTDDDMVPEEAGWTQHP
jgi:hypothetical protein